MDVKTVFKVLIGTIVFLVMASMLTEFYNASTNSALLRQKVDSAAESSLNYFSQESFRDENGYSTVNLPNFASADTPGTIYVSGHFYDYADNPEKQTLEMFDWYKGATSYKGYDDSKAFPVYELAACKLNDSYHYGVVVGGQEVGFDTHVKRLPTWNSLTSPYNIVVPGNMKKITGSVYAGKPAQAFGIINRYAEDINELSGWGLGGVKPMPNYTKIAQFVSKHNLDTSSSNTQYADREYEIDQLYDLGGMNQFTHVTNAVENAYTPFNVGFPVFSWQLNKMFKWNLMSALAGMNFTEDPATNTYVSSAITYNEAGVPYVRWNGFDVYVAQARITDINYYGYNLYEPADLDEFCAKAGLDATEVEELKRYGVTGYEERAYANTVISPDGTPMSAAIIVDIEYSVPMSYRGITPFREIANWETHQDAGGYGEFKDGTPATSPDYNFVQTQTTMDGKTGDSSFTVTSSLQYVVMP